VNKFFIYTFVQGVYKKLFRTQHGKRFFSDTRIAKGTPEAEYMKSFPKSG